MNDTVSSTTHPPTRSGRGLAALALVLSLAAIGLAAYPYYQQRFGGAEQVSVQLQAQQHELDQLQRALADASATLDTRLQQQQATLTDQLQAQDSRLAGVLADVSGSAVTAAGVARMTRVLGLTEAQYLVQAAARRLSLSADRGGAVALLAATQQVLDGIDAPASALQALRNVRSELAEQPAVDVDALFVRIETLSQNLPGPLPPRGYQAAPATAPAGDGVWHAALQKLLSLFEFHRRGELADAPLDVASSLQLKLNIELLLKTAQLALLRGDVAVYRDSLGAARKLLERYRGAAEDRATAAIAEIDQLDAAPLGTTAPDLGELLRQLQAALKAEDLTPAPAAGRAATPPAAEPAPAATDGAQ
jgi:uroporphyrin-III C-methyltransferase